MSKAKLRKELETFSAEQLRDFVMAVYDSSKEAKAFMEFFLNPDADALLEQKTTAIAKEANRSKYGRAKARTSVIKQHIKSFEAYGVGDEYVTKLMFNTLCMLIGQEQFLRYTSSHEKCVQTILWQYLGKCHTNGTLEEALKNMDLILNIRGYGTQSFRNRVRSWIDGFLSEAQITDLTLNKK